MKATDILRPKTQEQIIRDTPLWKHVYRTTIWFSITYLIKLALVWTAVGLMIAWIFVVPVFQSLWRLSFYRYYDRVDVIADSRFFMRMGGTIMKHGQIRCTNL